MLILCILGKIIEMFLSHIIYTSIKEFHIQVPYIDVLKNVYFWPFHFQSGKLLIFYRLEK